MHFCGDVIHDIVVNSLVFLALYPVWLPFGMKLKTWIQHHRH